MNWSPPAAFDWPTAGAHANALDPYVEWAIRSDWRGYVSLGQFARASLAESWITFVAEVVVGPGGDAGAVIDALAALPDAGLSAGAKLFYIPYAYRRSIPGSSVRSRFFTGRIRHRNLHRLRAMPQIARWELAQPVAMPNRMAHVESLGADLAGEREAVTPSNWNERVQDCLQSRQPAAPPDSLLGVIDYGCAFLHPAFRNAAGRTRLVQLWDQGSARMGRRRNWSPASQFGYGGVLWDDDIDRLLALHRPTGAVQAEDEAATYKAFDHLNAFGESDRPVRRWSHGTHVLDLAGGRIDPWRHAAAPDRASQAPLAFVQLPFHTAADGTGGSMAAHLLDAVRQLMTLVQETGKLVISISQGTHAGPHDGSSMIEAALDELLQARPDDFVIVVGAGNARHSASHVCTVMQPGETIDLALRIPVRDSTDSFVEIWYPRSDDDDQAHSVSVQATTPSGASSAFVPAGKSSALAPATPGASIAVASLTHGAAVPGGADAMALLALGPAIPNHARARGPHELAPCGTWTLRVRNEGTSPCPIDAWVERDQPIRPPAFDFPRWLVRPVATAGAARRVDPTPLGTLNTLAGAQHVLVAGALVCASGKPSGYGLPTPDMLAAADASTQLPGVRAAAVRGGDSVRMRGTSVAAPTLARQAYNFMADSAAPVERGAWRTWLASLRAGADDRFKPAS
jgi:Subtilase family